MYYTMYIDLSTVSGDLEDITTEMHNTVKETFSEEREFDYEMEDTDAEVS